MSHPDKVEHDAPVGNTILDFTAAAAKRENRSPSVQHIVNGIVDEVNDLSQYPSTSRVDRVDSYTHVVTDRHLPDITLPPTVDSFPQVWKGIQYALNDHLHELAASKPAFHNTVATRAGVLSRLGFRGEGGQIGLGLVHQSLTTWIFIESTADRPDVFLVQQVQQEEGGVSVSERIVVSRSRDAVSDTATSLFTAKPQTSV